MNIELYFTKIPESEIVESHSKHIWNFIGNWKLVFQSRYTILNSHQQFMRLTVALQTKCKL